MGLVLEKTSVPVVVLVSSQHGGVGIIRSLGRKGVPVYGVHQFAWEPAAFCRYLRATFRWNFSSASPAESVLFLLNVAKRIGQRPILLATDDLNAMFVADNAEALRRGFLFDAPSPEVVRSFCSKKGTYHLCRKLGIPTPATAFPQSRDEVMSFARNAEFPVIVKGEYGEFQRDGRLVRVAIVANEKELLKLYSPGLILQEYIPGGDDTIWMFNGYFNNRSECLFGVTGRKLRQSPPHRGGTSLGICERNEAVETLTKQLMQAAGYRGPLDIGCRYDARDGQYKLLDVNPRIGATFRLFVAENGLDVVRALYLDLTGQTVPPAQVQQGRKWIVESNDLISSWSSLRERELTLKSWIQSLRGVQEGAWLALDDPAPVAMLPLLWFHKHFREAALHRAVES